MANKEPPFTVGIEEEYLLVQRDTGEVDNDPPPQLLKDCTEEGSGQIAPEFLRSQIEVVGQVEDSLISGVPTGGGAAEPGLRSAVSAIIAALTPGMARTAVSACPRTLSQARASAASTLMEKNTLPSETVIADSTLALGKATPRGDITLERASSTCCCVTLTSASPKNDYRKRL